MKTLSEVKNTAEISYTSQIRDYIAIAKANELKFVLYVRPDAKLSRRVQEAVDRGEIALRFIPKGRGPQ